MRITFEFNDDEMHLVKWSLFKLVSLLGCNDGEKDPIEYKHKRSISNILDIPIQFQELFKEKEEKPILKSDPDDIFDVIVPDNFWEDIIKEEEDLFED